MLSLAGSTSGKQTVPPFLLDRRRHAPTRFLVTDLEPDLHDPRLIGFIVVASDVMGWTAPALAQLCDDGRRATSREPSNEGADRHGWP